MDYWFWNGRAVFVCADHLAWFDRQGRVIGPGGRTNQQPFDDYLARGPWLDGLPQRVAAELTAAVTAKQAGAVPPPVADPHPYRPATTGQTEWDCGGRAGVRFEGDQLLWYEAEGPERYASGAACNQTFASFVETGPWVWGTPAAVAAGVAAEVTARLAAGRVP